VERSPLVELLGAIDKLEVEAVVALCTPDCRFMTVDGRHASGRPAVGRLVSDFFALLRSTSHQITDQWHLDDAWIAEVLANYEMRDWLRLEHLPRVFVVRAADDGIRDVRVYGANERQLDERMDEPIRVGGRRILPL
jgi:hypothetical protein